MGSGWLGLALIEDLNRQGFQIKASTRSSSRLKIIRAQQAQACLVDIADLETSDSDFFDAEILIINITSKNIHHFQQLIKKIENSSIKKVLFISSTSVYANTNGVVTEKDQAELESSELFQIENLFRQQPQFETTVLRFAGLIGEGRHPAYFFSANKPIKNPQAPINLIHRDDCLHIVSEVIKQACWQQVFNACADTHPSKQQFYGQARSQAGLPSLETDRHSNADYKIVDNRHLKACLSYQFKHADLMKICFSTIN